MRTKILLPFAALIAATPAVAQVKMSGAFTATEACPAFQSIRKMTNPGEVSLEPGHAYPIVAKNREDATHYQVVIDGASPALRWVAVGCGGLDEANATPPVEVAPAGVAPVPAPAGVHAVTHVLALGWEPTFCRSHEQKAECRTETPSGFDATHLSLHGLWPQPRGKAYCGVDASLVSADKNHSWDDLPEPELSAAVKTRLAAAMPGFQSGLERHEWIVHGTCFGASADVYFSRAAELAEQVNASAVRDLFVSRIGQTLTRDDLSAAFNQAFGAGAGDRITLQCHGRGPDREIDAIVVSLAGDVVGKAPLGELMQAAAAVGSSCPSGLVRKVGG